MKHVNCWCCNKTVEFKDGDIFIFCDTVEGQYIEYEAITCLFCGATIEIGYHV